MPATQTRVRKTGAATGSGKAKAIRKAPARTPRAAATAAPAKGDESRQQMIARAAYFRAEKRGFAPGGELQDWFEAEAELDCQVDIK